MTVVNRRQILLRGAAALGAVAVAAAGVRGTARAAEKTIEVRAKRFAFEPETLQLVRGEPVVLSFRSLDVNMGFKCPDLGVRADIFPDRTTEIRFTPDKAGRFDFYCDVFCGDDHENMTGTVVVS